MGKGKGKKKTKVPGPESSEPTVSDEIRGSPIVQAMDGHNVDGWTELQIKAYNELLVEREKLEKQRKELETKSAKSHAGRALLNENVTNIDSVFKQQKSTERHVFHGKDHCCVEVFSTNKCDHELCTRSKTKGLTDTELDTIKYYATRIAAEKTERRRDALRKQRDNELIRLKKEDDHERAVSVRKSTIRAITSPSNVRENGKMGLRSATTLGHDILNGSTKETQLLVTNILEQLDGLRMDLQSGKISTTEMQKKLDTIDEEMQAAQLKPSKANTAPSSTPPMSHQDIMSSTKAFQEHIKDRIVNTKGDTYSKAFHIMEHFLSASKPGDFQAALSELKSVLRLSGPMGDELQKSFDALEGIFDSPDRLSFTGPDGKQECSSIIDLMAKMKETLKRTGKLPEGANVELVSVFEECIKLETEGKNEMIQECSNHLSQNTSTDLTAALLKIKSAMVTKSPIPPLTDQKLEDEMQTMLDVYDAKRLVIKANSGSTDTELEGYMTMLVMNRAQKVPEIYVGTIGRLARAYESIKSQEGSGIIDAAFYRVKVKMEQFVTKLAEKKVAVGSANTPNVNQNTSQSADINGNAISTEPDIVSECGDELPPDVRDVVQAACVKWVKMDRHSDAHLRLRTYISEYCQMGLWPLWLAWSEDEGIDEDLELQDKALKYEETTSLIMNDDTQGLKMAIIHLFSIGICPGMTAGIVSQLVTDIVDSNPRRAQLHMQQLADCMQGLPAPVTKEWSATFQHLAIGMIQLYSGLYVNAKSLFPSIPPLQFAVSTMSMVVSYTCLTRSLKGALHNFQLIWAFVNTCMSVDGVARVEELHQVAQHYLTFCYGEKYRCITLDSCSAHLPAFIDLADFEKQTQPSEAIESVIKQHLKPLTHKNSTRTNTNFPSSERVISTPENSSTKRKMKNHAQSTLETTIHYSKSRAKKEPDHALAEDWRYAAILRQAAQMHESTARKALELMQVKVKRWKAQDFQDLLASREFLRVVDNMLEGLSVRPVEFSHQDALRRAGPLRISEDIDEQGVRDAHLAQDVQTVQNIFEKIRNGDMRSIWPTNYARQLKSDVLNGHCPDPLTSLRRTVEKFVKIRNIPKVLVTALEECQNEVEQEMRVSTLRQEWKTRRSEFILNAIDAKAPTSDTFYTLASQNPGLFEEYCASLARKRAKTGHPTDEVRNLYSEILELSGNTDLHKNSECLAALARIAADYSSDCVENVDHPSLITDQCGDRSVLQSDIDHIQQSRKLVNSDNSSSDVNTLVQGDSNQDSSLGVKPTQLNEELAMTLSLNSAASPVLVRATDEVIAEEQSAKVEYHTAEGCSEMDDNSYGSGNSDDYSQANTIAPTNIPHKHNAPAGTDTGDDHNNASSQPATDASPNTITHDMFNQIAMVKYMSNLTRNINNLEISSKDIQKTMNKRGGVTAHQLKTLNQVTELLEQRQTLCREIVTMIAETKNYDMLKGYMRREGVFRDGSQGWSA